IEILDSKCPQIDQQGGNGQAKMNPAGPFSHLAAQSRSSRGDRHHHGKQSGRKGSPFEVAGQTRVGHVWQAVGNGHLLNPSTRTQEINENKTMDPEVEDGKPQPEVKMNHVSRGLAVRRVENESAYKASQQTKKIQDRQVQKNTFH